MGKPLGEEEIVRVGGVDVGHAPLVADDLHGRVKPVDAQAAVRRRHGMAHEAAKSDRRAQRARGQSDRQRQPLDGQASIRRVP